MKVRSPSYASRELSNAFFSGEFVLAIPEVMSLEACSPGLARARVVGSTPDKDNIFSLFSYGVYMKNFRNFLGFRPC